MKLALRHSLLLLLLASTAHGAVSQLGSTSSLAESNDSNTVTLSSHVVTASTDLLVVCAGTRNGPQVVTGIDWNTSEALTEISSNSPTDGNDPSISVWGIVSPTATTADVVVTVTSSSSWRFASATNYDGVDNGTVAAATNSLEVVDDPTGSDATTIFASGGTSGNALAFCASMIGGDADPVSNNASFVELHEEQTGALTGNGDAVAYAGHLLDAAPTGVTITWAKSDEDAGLYYEIVAAGAGNTSLRRRRSN